MLQKTCKEDYDYICIVITSERLVLKVNSSHRSSYSV